jgi:hypothetical protein
MSDVSEKVTVGEITIATFLSHFISGYPGSD